MRASGLPTELLIEIFATVDWKTLLICSSVCRVWNDLISDDYLWDPLIQKHFHSHSLMKQLVSYSSKQKFLLLSSLEYNWNEGRYQQYQSLEGSAVLCLCASSNKAIIGMQNTSIQIFDLLHTVEPKTGPICNLAKNQPIQKPKVATVVSKYVPPHLRNKSLPDSAPQVHPEVTESPKFITETIHYEKKLTGQMDSITAMKYSGVHNVFCSASNDATVRVWKLTEDEKTNDFNIDLMHTLRGHERSVRVIDFYNAQENNFETLLAASGSKDSTVRIWNVSSGEQIDMIAMEGAVHTLQFLDGLVACGDSLGLLSVYDIEAQQERFRFIASGKWLTSIRFDVQSNLIFSAGSDGRTRLFDIRTGGAVGSLYDPDDHRSSVNSIQVDMGRNLLINGGASIAGFDFRYPARHETLFQFQHPSWTNVLQLNGNRLVSALSDGYVGVYDTDISNAHTKFKLQAGKKSVLSVHADETKILAGTWDGYFQIFNFCHY
mmetsp:Transcript_11490/g.14218  ORF Transcript_11490/g.14218 Transcript_11490/m.14218 type:complete len:490 (-) Transcript_11490:43-1512(-)